MDQFMAHTHTVVAHFPSHREAERVVLELQKQGFDLQKLPDGKGNEQQRYVYGP